MCVESYDRHITVAKRLEMSVPIWFNGIAYLPAVEHEAVKAALRFYVDAFPAFRSKPVGAPGSIERQAQEVHAAQEDKARAILGYEPERVSKDDHGT
jgi:hypothetical protein